MSTVSMARPRAARKPLRIGRVLTYVALTFWSLIVLLPLYWMFTTAFKQQIDMFPSKKYIPFLQFTPKLNAFEYLFTDFYRQMVNAFSNSLIAALGSSILATLIGAMAGYALIRFSYKFLWMRGSDDFAFWFVSQRMLPPVAVVFPFLLMYRFIGLLDTAIGLLIAYTLFNLPLAVWIMRDAFRAVPLEIEESAWIDGASRFGSFFRIAMPLALPGIVASLLICFIFAWNEYLFALVLTNQRAQTLPVMLAAQATQQGNYFWNMAAISMVAIAPVLVLGITLQRWIVQGLSSGGLK
jgi:multiple sugar transport system permease protein